MRAATFKVDGALLGSLIHLPTTATFVDADADFSGNLTFTVTDEDLPEADHPHPATPTVTILTNPEDYVWDWGLS